MCVRERETQRVLLIFSSFVQEVNTRLNVRNYWKDRAIVTQFLPWETQTRWFKKYGLEKESHRDSIAVSHLMQEVNTTFNVIKLSEGSSKSDSISS